MLRTILKQLGILVTISILIIGGGVLWSNFDDSCRGSYWGCLPVSFIATILILILFWIFSIPYTILRLVRIYTERTATMVNDKSSKIINTLGIEIVYWILGVMIPSIYAASNLFHRGDWFASREFRFFTASFSILFVIVCSIIFWRRIRPPKYRTILFAFISLIFFLFSVLLSLG